MSDQAQRINELSPAKRDLLLRRLRERRGEGGAVEPDLPRLAPDAERRYAPFPLFGIQEAYWPGRSGLFDLGTVGANGYFELHFEGFSPARLLADLTAGFRRLIVRHPMLRMVMLPGGEQRILERVPEFEIEVADLRGLDEAAVSARLRASREELRRVQAPVNRWPLFEVRAFLLDRDVARLQTRFELLVLDGVMRFLLFGELFDLVRQPDLELPPVDCAYRDFVQAWKEFRPTASFRRSREFWLRLHERMLPAPELPLAADVGPATPSPFVDHEEWLLPPEAWSRLKTRLAELRLTPTDLVTTTFCEVLAAWTRTPGFTLAVSGVYKPPLHPHIERLIANFNSLTLLPVEGMEGDIAARARRLHDLISACLDHAGFSGFELVRELGRRRGGSSRTPVPVLFDSLLELQHRRYGYLFGGELGLDARVRYAEEGGLYAPQLLLFVMVSEMGGALHHRWRFVDGVFPPGLIQQMAEAHRRRLQSLAADPEAWTARWPEVLRFLTPSTAEPPPEPALSWSLAAATLTALFARQVAARPDAAALVAPGLSLTYRELAARAARLAAALRRAGVGRGGVVAIALAEGWEEVVAILAVLQAGAACLAADPRSGDDRIMPLLARCDAILTPPGEGGGEDGESAWPPAVRRLRLTPAGLLENPLAAQSEDEAPAPVAASDPDDAAYVLPAPAAEGAGAAAVFDHRAAVHALLAAHQRSGIGPEDRLLCVAPLCSEQGLGDVVGALLTGAALVLAPPAARRDAAALYDAVELGRPSVWSLTPALCERLVTCAEGRPDATLPAPRRVLLRGDTVPARLPARLAGIAPQAQSWLLSGAFGAALWSLCQPLAKMGPDGAAGGQPLAGQTVRVLGAELEPRPPWVVGEVFLGGPTLARAWWQDETASAARLLLHPRTGERLLRTGLLARWLPGGRLEWLGAPDAEQQILGYCVWLRRIEARLEQHPAVRGALVLPWRGAAGRLRPWAYVIPCSGRLASRAADDELARFLAESLPYYMLPAGFTMLEDWPLTPEGAVDRQALPAPPAARRQAGEPPPPDPLARELAQLVGDVLARDAVQVSDDFFALGGDSLLLTRLMHRVGERFGPGPPLWEFFYEPTPRHLARLVRRGAAGQAIAQP